MRSGVVKGEAVSPEVEARGYMRVCTAGEAVRQGAGQEGPAVRKRRSGGAMSDNALRDVATRRVLRPSVQRRYEEKEVEMVICRSE